LKRLKKVQGKKKEKAALEEEENAKKLLAESEKKGDADVPILQAAHESGQIDMLGDEEDEDIIF
jgi:V-type H+-transporting ATPase subunit D